MQTTFWKFRSQRKFLSSSHMSAHRSSRAKVCSSFRFPILVVVVVVVAPWWSFFSQNEEAHRSHTQMLKPPPTPAKTHSFFGHSFVRVRFCAEVRAAPRNQYSGALTVANGQFHLFASTSRGDSIAARLRRLNPLRRETRLLCGGITFLTKMRKMILLRW